MPLINPLMDNEPEDEMQFNVEERPPLRKTTTSVFDSVVKFVKKESPPKMPDQLAHRGRERSGTIVEQKLGSFRTPDPDPRKHLSKLHSEAVE